MKDPAFFPSQELRELRVSVVGLGLMGGSFAGALRGLCHTVVGVARRSETLETALARGLIDEGTTDLVDGVRRADVVVLATPVRATLRLLTEIGSRVPEGCLVTDLGSTKRQIVATMETLPDHVQPLGGHPMCGKEVSGIAAADPNLYKGQTFVLTPLPRTSEAALALGRSLVKSVGAHPLVLGPERHDRLVATVSHLPYLLGCALIDAAEKVALADPAVRDVAASGFRDTSRLAASDVTMMLDILLTNRDPVLAALAACEARLRHLAQRLAVGDEEGLRVILGEIQERRARMWGA